MRWVPLAAAAYTAATLVRYFVSGGPRFPVESAFFIVVGVGTIAVVVRRGGHADREGVAPHDAGPKRPGLQTVALAAAFILAALVLYNPALGIGLLSDDFVIARWAERLELVHLEATGFIRPGLPLFWGMLRALPGDFGVAAHAANIVLHGVNAALASVIALRFGVRRPEAVAAGAMFALFPGLSEAVAWLSGAQDVLMTTFALTAVVLATAADPKIVMAVGASVVGLLIKETAVVIPLLSALVVVARDGVRPTGRQRVALAWLAAVSVAYALARAAIGVPSSFFDVGDWRYFAKQLVANAFAGVGAPWTAEWGQTHAGIALVRAAAIVVLLAAAFFVWRRRDSTFLAAAASATWVLAAALPAFSLFYIGPNLEGMRYLYLSAVGFVILLALLISLAVDSFRVPSRAVGITLLTVLLAVPFLPAIRSDLRRWQAAAAIRDDVVARIRDEVDRSGCTTFAAEGEADSIDGAYVFRHGLAEALELSKTSSVVRCRVVLKAGELVLLRTEP